MSYGRNGISQEFGNKLPLSQLGKKVNIQKNVFLTELYLGFQFLGK
jgi:hypothetical protein